MDELVEADELPDRGFALLDQKDPHPSRGFRGRSPRRLMPPPTMARSKSAMPL